MTILLSMLVMTAMLARLAQEARLTDGSRKSCDAQVAAIQPQNWIARSPPARDE
jgi:hypothetical protein